jgi:hypothetical protein
MWAWQKWTPSRVCLQTIKLLPRAQEVSWECSYSTPIVIMMRLSPTIVAIIEYERQFEGQKCSPSCLYTNLIIYVFI